MWRIQDVARHAGVSSRTLRHYDQIGLLPPTSVGPGGIRQYDDAALVRLQRILLLRRLGLPLGRIATVVDGDRDDLAALRDHLAHLEDEQRRTDTLIRAVRTTIRRREEGEPLMPDETFAGFDHEAYAEEVAERWGSEAHQASDRWWRGLTDSDRAAFLAESSDLARCWRDAAAAGFAPDSDAAQALAERHHAWVRRGWGGRAVPDEALLGLADLYVADERFAAHYGGETGATYVRDALRAHVSPKQPD